MTTQVCIVSAAVLVANLKAVALFVSTDEARQHLNSVRFEVDSLGANSSTLRLVATDGHVLWINDAPLISTNGNDAFCICLADVTRIAKSLDVKGPDVEVWSDGKIVEVRQALTVQRAGILDVPFPPYETVIPFAIPSTEKRALSAINPMYLVWAEKAFTLLSKVEKKRAVCGLSIQPGYGELDPIIVVDEMNPSALLVIMPMRVGGFGAATRLTERYKVARRVAKSNAA